MPVSAEGRVEHQKLNGWVFGVQLDYSCRLKSVSATVKNRVVYSIRGGTFHLVNRVEYQKFYQEILVFNHLRPISNFTAPLYKSSRILNKIQLIKNRSNKRDRGISQLSIKWSSFFVAHFDTKLSQFYWNWRFHGKSNIRRWISRPSVRELP